MPIKLQKQPNLPVGPSQIGTTLLVVLTAEELDQRIEQAVIRAQPATSEGPAYRDRKGMAIRLGVSLATIDRLLREGMPFVLIGESRRMRDADVDRWLSERSAGARP